jgi:hypothetical protein
VRVCGARGLCTYTGTGLREPIPWQLWSRKVRSVQSTRVGSRGALAQDRLFDSRCHSFHNMLVVGPALSTSTGVLPVRCRKADGGKPSRLTQLMRSSGARAVTLPACKGRGREIAPSCWPTGESTSRRTWPQNLTSEFARGQLTNYRRRLRGASESGATCHREAYAKQCCSAQPLTNPFFIAHCGPRAFLSGQFGHVQLPWAAVGSRPRPVPTQPVAPRPTCRVHAADARVRCPELAAHRLADAHNRRLSLP